MKKFVVNGNGFDWVEKKDAWKGKRARNDNLEFLRILKIE